MPKPSDEITVSGAYAVYRGNRFLILHGGEGWAALRAEPDVEIPDAFERGESRLALGQFDPWAKVPTASLEGVIDVDVTATLRGHEVSLRQWWADGRIRVWFVGPPAAARELRLDGDQYMGWTGLFAAEEFEDIRVVETRRAGAEHE
jgi:hypothetical protein